MSRFNPLLWPKPPAIWGYGIAVLSVVAALLISRWPPLHLESALASLFLCAVMISAWLGGVGPGLLATVLSCLAFNYYFLEPLHSFAAKPQEIPRFVTFVVSALVAGSLGAAQRSATESLRSARDYLTETVKELQRTNEALQAESRERMQIEDRLRRSEGYLAEAQRLTHTGSFGWSVQSGEIRWSDETYRIFEWDPKTKPTVAAILQRTHPDEIAFVKETVERASREQQGLDFEHRLLMQDGSIKYIRVVAHAVRGKSGEIEFVGAVMDTTEGKRAEKKLRRSEESLLEAQKLSHTGSWRHDVASGAIEVSPEIYRMHDIKPDEDPSNTEFFFGRFHPEDRKRVVDLFEKSETEKTELEVDYRIVLPDGTIKYLHTIGRPVLNESGDLVEFVGTVMDLTAAKQAEEALRRSESYLAEAQRLSHTGSWARDAATDEIKYSSEEFYRVVGFDPRAGQPRYEAFLQRIHPDDQARVREIAEKARREKAEYELDYRIIHPGGDIRDIHVIGHPVLSPSGDLAEFVGTVMDVTERKRAEGALRRSEAYLAEAQRLSHTGSWALVPGMPEISYMSEECYRLMGFDSHDGPLRFEMVLQRLHPEDQARIREVVETADREKSNFELDYRVVHPGGEIRDVHAVGHPVLSPSGDLVELVGTVIDITERKRAEEERERLRQAQADLARVNRVTTMGELTASLAHEVNQPIGAAVTNASTCLRWLAGDTPNLEEARAAAMRVVTDGRRAAEIISRVRQLFKKGRTERELLDINEVVREMIVILQGEAARQNIVATMDLAEDLPHVLGDRVQLQQVMMNLIMNGIDAMKSVYGARDLAVSSRLVGNEEILVSVSDTGVGLPPKQADQIFNAFFTTKLHGTGMGLRISGTIVESHGGRLWAEDNSPRGARFHFTLPTKIEAHE
jgi:PAS domain S-box-containing protein